MADLLLLFPGQGSQAVGMGRYLWETYPVAREVFSEAEDLLGWNLRGLCLDGPIEELTRTDRAQPAIFVCSVAAWRVLEGAGVDFRVAVGHSLGEYSVLVATGQLDFAAGLRVVERRGAAMYACGQEDAGTMAAIIGLADDDVDALCAEVGDVWPANYNCPGQVVVSGRPAAVEAALRLARERGARRTLPLQVSGAFHTPLVAGAARQLADVLDGVAIHAPTRGSFFSTTELRYPETDDIKETMVRQLTSPVRFSQSMGMLLDSLESGLEVGPGAVLAGLVKRSAAQFPVLGTGDAASLEDALERLNSPKPTGRTQVSDEVLSLAGKVAMVTGGARGIGRSIALLLAQRGADVAVVDLDAEGAAAVAAEIEALGRRATSLRANVSVEADVRDAVAASETALGPIDILVNNAGLTRDGFMARMSEADWDLVLDVNLKGAFLLSKAVSRGMMKQRSGSIVNMASVVGRRGNAGQVNYSAAKAGLIGLTKSLARELASRNVRVNAIAPGYIQTEMTAGLSEAVKETIVGGTPLGRMGTPDDVAQAVAFLASGAAAFITGTVLPVDGGLGI